MAVVTPRARVVQGLLRRSVESLTRPQRSHLVGLVLALLSGSTAKLRPLAERSSAARHRTCEGRFLAVTEWDETAALDAQYADVLRRLRVRRGDSIELVLDDTRFAKRGRKMDDLSRMWDHAHASFADVHTLLVVAVRARGVTLPWALRLCLPKRSAGRHYQKLTDMAPNSSASSSRPRACG
jgi:hypothetical protein